jgi:hypothetical protein
LLFSLQIEESLSGGSIFWGYLACLEFPVAIKKTPVKNKGKVLTRGHHIISVFAKYFKNDKWTLPVSSRQYDILFRKMQKLF